MGTSAIGILVQGWNVKEILQEELYDDLLRRIKDIDSWENDEDTAYNSIASSPDIFTWLTVIERYDDIMGVYLGESWGSSDTRSDMSATEVILKDENAIRGSADIILKGFGEIYYRMLREKIKKNPIKLHLLVDIG